jgi:hypothetical protein
VIVLDNNRVGLWIKEHGGGEYRTGSQCIGLERNGELVAGVLYDYCNGASIYMHVAITGRITREFLCLCFEYPFVQLGCNLIIGLVPDSNEKAKRFDEHLGFNLHSRIPNGCPDGDLLIYIMRREDCRFIGENRYGKTVSTARS